MEKSQPQPSFIFPSPGNPLTPLSDNRRSFVAEKFRDALFSVVAAKYATKGSGHTLPFPSEQFESIVERRLHEYFPSFHTPTHPPYASMIQRAIAEVEEEDGLSEESISEFIVNKYEDLPWAHTAFLRRHLGKLCDSGELVKSKCGMYNFKVEGKEVKRKKRGRKSAAGSRRPEVESADEIEEDCDRKKRSKRLVIIGPRAEEIVTGGKRIEEQSDSLREVIVRAENGDHAHGGRVVVDELEEKEVQEDEVNDSLREVIVWAEDGDHAQEGRVVMEELQEDEMNDLMREVIVRVEDGDHAQEGRVVMDELEEEVQEDEMNDSLREVIVRAEDGDHAQGGQVVMDELEEEVQKDEMNDSLVIVRAEDGGHVQGGQVAMDELEEVQEDEMIDKHHGEEIKYKYGPKDFDRQKKLRNLVILGLPAPVTFKGIEKQSGSLGEEVHEAEEGDHTKGGQIQVLGELKEVRADVMIDPHCEKEVKTRDDVQVFDEKKQSQPRKALTMTGTEENCVLSREEIDGSKEGGHDQERKVIMIYKLQEVRKVGMINDHHEVEVKSRDGDENFGGRKQLQELVVVGLPAEEALTTKETESQCRSLREKNNRAERDRAHAGQTEVLDQFKEVQEVEMIDVHHEEERQGEVMEERSERASKGSNVEDGPSEEATLEFFDAMSNHSNGEENGVIDGQGCKKLLEKNENLEFFDAKSDHGDNGANEIIGGQSSEGKALGEVSSKQNRLQEQLLSRVSDDQTGISKGCEAEDPQLSKEQPQVRWPSEITGTPSTSIVATPPPEHLTETPKHSEKGMMPRTYDALLPSDIICSPKSQPRGHRGRGRPRKVKVQETLATSFSSSAQDCDQQYLESNVEERDTSGPDTGNVTHHVDQQQLKLTRGRGRGRPRVVRRDQIPSSERFSHSKHLHHQQSPEKRCRGRPPKRKFDEDTVSKDVSTPLENEQQEQKGRGCGRPSRGRKKDKESFDNQ